MRRITVKNRKLIAQGLRTKQDSLLSSLRAEVSSKGYRRISACAAYASPQGVVLLRSLLAGKPATEYRWLIGLDDTFTSPDALTTAVSTRRSETRVAALLGPTLTKRFHPKLYLLDRGEKHHATLMIGSSNLTKAALSSNCEANVVLYATTTLDAEELSAFWELFWTEGEPLTQQMVDSYRERFRRRKQRQPEVAEELSSSLPKDVKNAARVVLRNSSLAWIIIGKNTGGGKQLDLVKGLSPFLGLPDNPRGGQKSFLLIDSDLGKKRYQLSFTKGMWRFMNLQQGFDANLRPNLRRASPFLLVLEKEADSVDLAMRLLRRGTPEAKRLVAESKRLGFLGTSVSGKSGRQYGWH